MQYHFSFSQVSLPKKDLNVKYTVRKIYFKKSRSDHGDSNYFIKYV